MRRKYIFLLFGSFGLVVLMSLGVWQLQRLSWKAEILHAMSTRLISHPQALPRSPDREVHRYWPVGVDGMFLSGEIHVLVSVKRKGAGYRVIAPFETVDGRIILIDRGFVPVTEKDKERVRVASQVWGNLHWPDEIDGFTPEPDLVGNIWFARDVERMSAYLRTEPVLLIARSVTDEQVTPLPIDASGIPNNHLQYAITWFSLAFIWVAMSLYFLLRDDHASEV